MADATGAPTSLGIHKYNTSVDAPSGLGFNSAMDDIDALLVARIPKTLLTTVGDIVYASGVSVAARLGIGAGGTCAWSCRGSTSLGHYRRALYRQGYKGGERLDRGHNLCGWCRPVGGSYLVHR